MVYFDRVNHGMRVREVWFCSKRQPQLEQGQDIIEYHDCYAAFAKPAGLIKTYDSPTLFSDLQAGDEALLASFSSNVRYEVRRAEKDGVSCEMFDSAALLENEALPAEFNAEYEKMHAQKGLSVICILPALQNYARHGMLYLSVARHEGQVCAYHSYLADGKFARLLHSVSVFRDEADKSVRAVIGRANRRLHFEDMRAFAQRGFETMDWGGICDDREELKNITEFKEAFGGRRVHMYYYKIALSARAKLLSKLRK